MSFLCRICLQSTVSKPVDCILIEFHYDLCEKDVGLKTDVIFCTLCEEVLKNFYEFRQKCRYSNEIFKNTLVHLNPENQEQLVTLQNADPEYPEKKKCQPDDNPTIKVEKDDIFTDNIEQKPDIDRAEQCILKIEDIFYCDGDIFNNYDDDEEYIPEKRKKKKKEKVKQKNNKYSKEQNSKKNKITKEQTLKNKNKVQTSKSKLRDRILKLLERGELRNLGEVEMNEDLFVKMFDKSTIGSARCSLLLQNPDTKEELERLTSFLLYLLKKNNPEYEEMFNIERLDTEELKLREFRARRVSKEYLTAEYKCDLCCKVFDVRRLLEYHRKWHEPSTGSNVCEICSMRFARRKSLAQHHKDNHCAVYRCRLCPLVTYNFSVMVNHFHHHKGKEYPCPVCLSVFSNKSTMNNHRLQAHKTAHVCDLCARCFVSEKGLYFHKQLKHKGEDATNSSLAVSCDKCDVTLSSAELLATHVKQTHSALIIHKCFYCKEVFRSLEELRQHKVASNHQRSPRAPVKSQDDMTVPLNKEDKPFCVACDKTFSTRKGYLRHYNINHNANRIYKCGFCQAKFTSTEEIEAHRTAYNHHLKVRYVKRRASAAVKQARTDKPFDKCELCGETVGTGRVNGMYQHFVTSHPDTPYSSVYRNPHNRHLCELCGKTFKDLRFFLDHRNVHTGARPYACGVCARTFATRRHLAGHAPRHAAPRRACRLCPKLFHSAANLFAHTRSHVGDRRFKCDICSKGFLHQAALNEHVRGVHNHIRRARKCRDK